MKTLLYTTTAFVLCGGIVQANAACIATPSCTAMGYTSSSSCTNGIKCPFGNYWNCDLANKITELEEKINSGGGTKPIDKTYDCKIGDIFYSDWSCSTDVVSGKIPIAVVVYMDGAGHGQALALKSAGNYMWQGGAMYNSDGEFIDSAVSDYDSVSAASKDFNSCVSTQMLIFSGSPNDFPAAWAANYYKTAGTEAGDWCLPAAGIFTSYYNNKSAVNAGFDKVGGTKFTNSTSAWSSSEYGHSIAWHSSLGKSNGLYYDSYGYSHDYDNKFNDLEVRPVLAF